jgi:hypothetical protein
MQIREFSQPVTSKKLNEGLAKKFGYKINLEQFSDVQLEDARNKLRTKISQFELSESFDSVLESPDYQKTRMFLDCINQEIMEREESKCDDCGHSPCDCDAVDESQDEEATMTRQQTEESYIASIVRQRANKLAVPQSWIESTIRKINLGEADRDELKAELSLRYDLNESQASWMLLEGEEDKAEIIMATKDMVDRITGWLEDVAAMKAEQLLELTDSIGKALGSDVAQAYQDAVKPALEAIYTALETSRQGLSQGLSTVSGGGAPVMGAPTPSIGGADLGAPAGGEAPEMGGGEEEAMAAQTADMGREKRESVDYSRRLGILLNSKKK